MFRRQLIKRVLGRDICFTLGNGRRLLLPQWSGFSSVVWVTGGRADDGCEEVMETFADPKRRFCDVGAHFGYWGVRMAHCSHGVLAVEPNPICHAVLQQNLSTIQDVQLAKCALSDKLATLRFFADRSPPHSRLLDTKEEIPSRAGEILLIPVRTLDEIWKEGGSWPIWGVKMDTEGHEVSVLLGAFEMITKCEPLLLLETTRANLSLCGEFFGKIGYEAGWLSEREVGKVQDFYVVSINRAILEFTSGMLFLLPPWTRMHSGWTELRRSFVVVR